MTMKKILLWMMLATWVAMSYAFAQESSGYKDVIVKEDFNFSAYLKEWWKVYMTWNSISKFSDSAFKYYKVIRSSTNSNPTYPEDGYITFSEDKEGFTSYTDEKAPTWKNYYRVCAIMQDNNRYCSPVKQIDITNVWTTQPPSTQTKETSATYSDVISKEEFNFIADFKEDGKVYMSWIPISKFNDWAFKYYKIVRSSTNSNPRYPEDGYIKYSEDKESFISYVDENPPSGTNYYRLCAIMQDNTRYCSLTKQVNVIKNTAKTFTNQTTTNTGNTQSTPTKTKIELSINSKTILDNWVSSYIKKLNEKYGENFATINSKVQETISKLEKLKTQKTHLTKYIDYIIDKLSESTWLDDISNILNEV